MSYHQAGRLAEAKQSYLEILSREQNSAVALHLLGVIRSQEGNAGQAIELIGKAIALRPDYAEAHNNLGNALNDLDRLTALRSGLRERMRASPLCDADAFARNVETAYRDMWRTWCNAGAGRE